MNIVGIKKRDLHCKCQLAAQQMVCLLIDTNLCKGSPRIIPTLVLVGDFHNLCLQLLPSWHFLQLTMPKYEIVLVKWHKSCVYVHVTGLAVLESVLDNIPHTEKLDIGIFNTHSN